MFCRKCGKELDDGIRFCPACGTEVMNISPVSAVNDIDAITQSQPQVTTGEEPITTVEEPIAVDEATTAEAKPAEEKPAEEPIESNISTDDTSTVILDDSLQYQAGEQVQPDEQTQPEEGFIESTELQTQPEETEMVPVTVTEEQLEDEYEYIEDSQGEAPAKTKTVMLITIIVASILVIASALLIVKSQMITNRYDGKAWYEGAAFSAPDESGLKSFDFDSNGSSSMATEWNYGSTTVTHMNEWTMDDEYYYTVNPQDNGYLCKITKAEPHTVTRVAEIAPAAVQCVDGVLYINNSEYNNGYEQGVYSLNTDGSQLQCISEGLMTYMFVVNDWIYYIRGMDNALCKINMFDRREIVLHEKVGRYDVYKNNIYLRTYREVGDDKYENAIKAIDVDGNELFTLHDWSDDGTWFTLGDGQVFVLEPKADIAAYNADNGEYLGDDFYKGYRSDMSYYYYGGKFYYIDYSAEDQKLAVVDTSTGEVLHYNPTFVTGFDFIDGMIVIKYTDGITPMITVNDLETGKNAITF